MFAVYVCVHVGRMYVIYLIPDSFPNRELLFFLLLCKYVGSTDSEQYLFFTKIHTALNIN